MTVDQTVLRLLSGKSQVRTLTGWYRGLDGDRMTVDVGGGRFPAYPLIDYLPATNERVVVWIVDDVPFVAGPVVAHPVDGVVVSTGSGLMVVSTSAGNVSATYELGASPTAGQNVKLIWGGEVPHGLLTSAAPVAGSPSGGSSSTTKTYTQTFRARGDSGSYNTNWWTNQVWSSDNNLGAWFYGDVIRNTIPSGASILEVAIYLPAIQIFGSPSNFGLHNHSTRPGGAPSIGSTTSIAPVNGWLGLPGSFGTALRAGGSARGVGVAHGGYHKFASVAEDGMSGALRIKYNA